jgi:hypothetical protein
MPSIEVKLFDAKGLKIQRWTGDNAPYVTIEAKNLGKPSATWRSATAVEADNSRQWQRGSNVKWKSSGCSFEYAPQSAGGELPQLLLTCIDDQGGSTDKIIGTGTVFVAPLLRLPGQRLRSTIQIYGKGRGTLHGAVEIEICNVAPQQQPQAQAPAQPRAQPASGAGATATAGRRYYSVNPARGKDYFDAADNAAVAAAHQSGVPAVRLADKPYGKFEVRFGANAVSSKMTTPPKSEMAQVRADAARSITPRARTQ